MSSLWDNLKAGHPAEHKVADEARPESSRKRKRQQKNLIGYWLCDALKPYTTEENEMFVRMIAHFNKRFTVPSAKVL